MNSFVLDFFKANDVKYSENHPMSRLTTIRIGGTCDVAACPDSEEKLALVVRFLRKNKIRFKIIGKMSNILPTDDPYRGVIVRTDGVKRLIISDNEVYLSSGTTLRGVTGALTSLGLSGYEELVGIPGCVGGLVAGNAGAFSRETADLVKSVKVLRLDTLDETTLFPSQLSFSYRDSVFKHVPYLILGATLELKRADSEKIRLRIAECKARRAETQPIDFPSLGSVFKRPLGVSAAELIDKCGLKGLRVGGAEVSHKHAGFIVNWGGATAKDVKHLIREIKKRVEERYSIALTREIEFLGV